MQNTNQLSVLAASWDRNLSHNLAKNSKNIYIYFFFDKVDLSWRSYNVNIFGHPNLVENI